MHLAVIGPGRLGRSLHVLAPPRGVAVTLVGRDLRVPPDVDACLLTVPDRVVAEVARHDALTGHVVLHAAGSLDLAPVAHHPEHGSFHPLMSFPGPALALPDLAGVPAAVDGTPGALQVATRLAEALGMRPLTVPGDRRLYHAAAVVAGNLATVLLAEAATILTAAGVPAADAPGLLAPLALTSLRNAASDPAAALTGPAARGDHAVLDGHRDALRRAGLDALLPWYDANVARALALAATRR